MPAVTYVPVPTGSELVGQITRPFAVLPLLLYGIHLFIQWQDIIDHETASTSEGFAVGREWVKLDAYLVFILWIIIETVGTTHVLKAV